MKQGLLAGQFQKLRHAAGLMKVKWAPKAELSLREGEQVRFFILGTPNHGNLGDWAIAFAQEEMIRKNAAGAGVYFVSETDYWKVRGFLLRQVRKEDVLVLTGGGNLGDLYPYAEDLRRDAIKSFPHQQKILFPQSLAFVGHAQPKRLLRPYRRAENLVLFARERESCERMAEALGVERVCLVPDIALSLSWPVAGPIARSGVLVCLRKDGEAKLTQSERSNMITLLRERFCSVTLTDTVAPGRLNQQQAKKALADKLRAFRQAELVVTDRLHGMIFAALTQTPCVSLSNFNQKVREVYRWLEDFSYIRYVDDPSSLEDAITEVLSAKPNAKHALQALRVHFEPLEGLVRRS